MDHQELLSKLEDEIEDPEEGTSPFQTPRQLTLTAYRNFLAILPGYTLSEPGLHRPESPGAGHHRRWPRRDPASVTHRPLLQPRRRNYRSW